jgi:PAS domain S-box-containing protein
MKWQGHNPAIPNVAIAVSAAIAGIIVALRFAPSTLAHGNRSYASASSSLSIGAIAVFTLIVVGLVFLKSRLDQRYQMERELLEAFLEHIPDNVFFKDCDSRFVRVSRAMADYCGLANPAQAVGKADSDIFSPEHADQAFADEQEIIRTGEAKAGIEEKETWPDGHESWVLTTKIPLKDRHGRIIGTMGIAHDITDRKQAEVQIRYMALHDALTGLPNRILLEDRLTQSIALARRSQKSIAVLMLDLDRFKNVNDSYGH